MIGVMGALFLGLFTPTEAGSAGGKPGGDEQELHMDMSDDFSMRVVTIAAPVRTQVVESLRGAILDGRLAPGRRLIEKDLCQMLGVSRPSVREALRALEAEGLISSIPNRGPVVTELTPEDAASIYQVRGALEALAPQLFTINASDVSTAERFQATAAEQKPATCVRVRRSSEGPRSGPFAASVASRRRASGLGDLAGCGIDVVGGLVLLRRVGGAEE